MLEERFDVQFRLRYLSFTSTNHLTLKFETLLSQGISLTTCTLTATIRGACTAIYLIRSTVYRQ